jgi:predicted dehydrogenase
MGCHEKGRGFKVLIRAALTEGCEIAVVCDVDSRAREAAAAKVLELTGKKPEMARDVRKVLERKDIDGLVCCAPDHWHAWAAVAAMKAGKAIYVEKPCSFCASECEVLERVQRETGAVFQMGSQRRSSAPFIDAVKAVQDGAIGEVHFARCWNTGRRKPIGKGKVAEIPEWLDWDLWQGPAPREAYHDNYVHYNWHWFKTWGTGECPNNATHFVDLARWAMNLDYPERTVSLAARSYYDDDWQWYDVQNCTWQFPGKNFITWEGHCATKYPGPSPLSDWAGCFAFGSKGNMHFGPNGSTMYDLDGNAVKQWNAAELMASANIHSLTDPTRFADVFHIKNFVEAVRANDPALCNQPVDSAVRSTMMVHLGNIAAQTGEAVKTDPKTGKLLPGSAGAEFWGREYEKGWELA